MDLPEAARLAIKDAASVLVGADLIEVEDAEGHSSSVIMEAPRGTAMGTPALPDETTSTSPEDDPSDDLEIELGTGRKSPVLERIARRLGVTLYSPDQLSMPHPLQARERP